MRRALHAAAFILPPLALFLLIAGAFSPTLKTGITALDDVTVLLRNPNVQSWSWDHLKAMGFSLGFGYGGSDRTEIWRSGVFQPISWLTHAADFSLWGTRFEGHHATSIVFHAANGVLAYVLILLLIRLASPRDDPWQARLAALVGAAAWGLQPLRVQPVGWLSTRSYLVPTFFALLSAIAYLKGRPHGQDAWTRRRWLAASWLAFTLSLLSKSLALMIPVTFLALDVWPLRRLSPAKSRLRTAGLLVLEKLPFYAVGLILFAISLKGRQGVSQHLSLPEVFLSMLSAPRLSQAAFETSYFLEKSILPFRIIGIYELREPWHPLDQFFGMRTLSVLAITIALLAARRRWPAGLAFWVNYLVTLAPLSGLVLYDMANQIGEDKYSYLASIWLGAAAGFAALAALRAAKAPRRLLAARALLGAVVAGLAAATFAQARLWADQDRWWQYSLAVNPDCFLCRVVLGLERKEQGRFDEAVQQCIDVARVWPDSASGEIAVAQTIEESIGAMPEPGKSRALARIRQAFDLLPPYPDLHYRLAAWHDSQGRLEDAIAQMRLAARYDAGNPAPRFQLGLLYDKKGDREAALAQMREAGRLAGQDALTHFKIGLFLGDRGQLKPALEQTILAAKYDPKLWPAHFNLGIYYANTGQFLLGEIETRKALALDPNNARGRYNLGYCLLKQGKLQQARREFQESLKLDPSATNTRQNLSFVESLLSQRAGR